MITIERIKQFIEYDAQRGHLIYREVDKSSGWTARRIKQHNSQLAGFIAVSDGRITIDGWHRSAKRVAWALAYGEWPHRNVKAIDKNNNNLKLNNLTLCSEGLPYGVYTRTTYKKNGNEHRYTFTVDEHGKASKVKKDV